MSKKEVEIRFLLKPKKYKDILVFLKKNSKKIETLRQEDTYYCHNSYIESNQTKITPYILRIRETEKYSKLAYKSFKKEGSWVEIETKIENIKAMKSILSFVEHSPYLVINKKRISGKINSIEINLDNIHNLGLFVELEKIGENFEKEREILTRFAETNLELNESNMINRGYVQLMEDKFYKNL